MTVSKLPYVLGGGALAAFLWSRGRDSSSRKPVERPENVDGEWVWPVPALNGRTPVVSDGFDSHREGKDRHGGVDIMYKRQPKDPFRPGSPNGSRMFVMPDGIPALAARDGIVWSAMMTPVGLTVVIDHGKPFATYYTHLERLLVAPVAPDKRWQQVVAGQPIGIIGFSPLDGEKLMHLHFELWRGGPKDKIDPEIAMRSWKVLPSARETLVARNGGLAYRPFGNRGAPYPHWVRDLAYAIRDRDNRDTLDVGSSVRRRPF